MAYTALTPWAIAQSVTASKLNAAQAAIGELQASTARVYFEQTKTGLTVASGAVSDWGSWTSSGGFTASGTSPAAGVAVPTDGVYAISQTWRSYSFQFTVAAFIDIDIGTTPNQVHRANPPVGVGESLVSGTLVMALTAGQLIIPQRYQNSGSSFTGSSIALRISRISI